MAIPILGGIVAILTSALAKTILDRVLFFLALKALATMFFILVIPIILKNWVFGLIEMSLGMVNDAATGQGYSGIVELSQLAAWFVDVCRLPDALAAMVGAFQLHLFLRMLPFSPVKK